MMKRLFFATVFILQVSSCGKTSISILSQGPSTSPSEGVSSLVYNVDPTATANDADADLSDLLCEDASGKCSLQAAISQAFDNADNSLSTTVNIPVATYLLTAPIAGVFNDVTNPSSSVTIIGADRDTTILDGQSASQVLSLAGNYSLSNVTIQNGLLNSMSRGAGMYIYSASTRVITLDNVKFLNNQQTNGVSSRGGAIDINIGDVSITNSIFDGNEANDRGSAIYANGSILSISDTVFQNNDTNVASGVEGCAIYSTSSSNTFSNLTITNNCATNALGGNTINIRSQITVDISNISIYSNGVGGVALEERCTSTPCRIVNSTIAGNTGATGRGIYHTNLGGGTNDFQIIHTTLEGNENNIVINGVNVDIQNSIVSGAVANNCSLTAGTITSLGYSIDDDTTCGLASGTDITLSPSFDTALPTNNGGSTPTILLSAGSQGRDAIPIGSCTIASTDQRGTSRPQSGACDIGATEQ